MEEVRKKKGKLDLSTLCARELLLIGESSTFSQQPSSSKAARPSSIATESDESSGDTDENESSDDSLSESDWEEVKDDHVEAQLQKFSNKQIAVDDDGGVVENKNESQLSQIPAEGLQIVIPHEGVFRKTRKEITIEDIVRRQINSDKIKRQELIHKISLLCQIAKGLHLNNAISSELLRPAFEEKLKGKKFSAKRLNVDILGSYINWFRCNMLISKPSMVPNLDVSKSSLAEDEFLAYQIMEKTFLDSNYFVLIFAAFLRHLNIDVRLVIALVPASLKPLKGDLIRKPKEVQQDDTLSKNDEKKTNKTKSKAKVKSKRRSKNQKKPKAKVKIKPQKSTKSKGKKGRKAVSSSEDEVDGEEDNAKKGKCDSAKPRQDMWVEVYLTEDERWVSVDILSSKVVCDKDLEVQATKPITYILAFEKSNKIKDVTRRYASEWLSGTQKLRIRTDWWNITLKPFRGKRNARDEEEDAYLDEHLMSLPIPKSVSEIKGHKLFVLPRHLLKYEALYPEDTKPLGFIKEEPVYSRDNVHTLHTRELWMREARVVRIGETPFKIVKARPKYDKLSGARLPEAPSELFGRWQTEDFIPPIAQDGKVPRNEWGNVELFTEKLLPQGCVHLQLPGLQRIAKKLDIDCAPAVVGFDFGCGGSRPAFDGFVVCEEFEEILVDAWNQDQDERQKKEEEKRLQRIYGNWRKLIKGVLIRDRLEKKYSINLSGKRKGESNAEPTSSKRSRRN